MMNINPMQLMQMFRGNPQQAMQQLMGNSQIMSNPTAKNALNMAQKGDFKGIEQIARNICKENGVNPEEMYNNVKNRFGM